MHFGLGSCQPSGYPAHLYRRMHAPIQQQAHIGAAPAAECTDDGLVCKTSSDCCSSRCSGGKCTTGTTSYHAMPSVSDVDSLLCLPKRDHVFDVFASHCISRGIDQSLCDALKKSCVFQCESAAFQFLPCVGNHVHNCPQVHPICHIFFGFMGYQMVLSPAHPNTPARGPNNALHIW
jgi:hypothetical protein